MRSLIALGNKHQTSLDIVAVRANGAQHFGDFHETNHSSIVFAAFYNCEYLFSLKNFFFVTLVTEFLSGLMSDAGVIFIISENHQKI